MDYQFSPEEVKLQQELAAFCRTEIAPRAKMLDRASRQDVGAYMKENLRLLAGGGWLEAGQDGRRPGSGRGIPGGRRDRQGVPGDLPERPGEHLPVRRGIAAVRHA